jgi:hypothetical protein
MGMYDEIKCEYKLPDSEVQEHIFQTKDFENLLDRYIITEEGKLIWKKSHWENVPEEERPYYGTEQWNQNPLFQTIGSLKTIFDEDVFMEDYFGEVIMYTIYNKTFYEYKVRFIDGKVFKIIPMEKEKINDALHKERE